MLKRFTAIALLTLTLAACGEVVEVPPAYEGKILTSNGYKPDSIPPSKIRLEFCLNLCDRLVLVEKSDRAVKETLTVFMPRNQLTMTFDLRMTASIKDNQTDAILNRIPAQDNPEDSVNVPVIDFNRVYATYGANLVRDIARSVVARYTIDEVASSREEVNNVIRQELDKALSVTPIALKTAGLGKVQYPDVIVKRKEQAEERRIEIEQEEARKQVELIKLQTELEKAKAQRAIRREKAEAAAEENRIAATSITDEYLQYKRLEVLDNLAKAGASVFVPFEALDEVGLSQRIFNKKDINQ